MLVATGAAAAISDGITDHPLCIARFLINLYIIDIKFIETKEILLFAKLKCSL